MQPIHELLSRIRWDPNFGQGEFVIGVYDRVEKEIVLLPLKSIQTFSGEHHIFHYLDEEGEEHRVPFHRIKAVYKNGQLIWHREQ